MTFEQFITLLDFVPTKVLIYSDSWLLGEYGGKEAVWYTPYIQSLKVKVISINRADETVKLEVAE